MNASFFHHQFEWPPLKENQRETMLLYRFGYLPAGLFNRSQVRLFQYSNADIIWKNGSVLKKNDHLALIKEMKYVWELLWHVAKIYNAF